jgi:hypothetical protein
MKSGSTAGKRVVRSRARVLRVGRIADRGGDEVNLGRRPRREVENLNPTLL